MNIGELLGSHGANGDVAFFQRPDANSLGGGSDRDSLTGMLGGLSQKGGGGLGEALSGMMGGSAAQGGGGIADVISGMLGGAGRAVGGNQNLALGGLGALVGSLLGGGGKSLGGAVGGGLMALLGAMAFNALKGSGEQKPQIPVGLLEPQTDAEKTELEQHSEIILRAMINAAKADGQIDEREINRIAGKLKEVGADAEGHRYLVTQLQQPMETERLIAAAQGSRNLRHRSMGQRCWQSKWILRRREIILINWPPRRVYPPRSPGAFMNWSVCGRHKNRRMDGPPLTENPMAINIEPYAIP